MKKFAKLLVVALAVAIIASTFSVAASATDAPAAEKDPNNLKPGSEQVIFIKDAPRDEDYKIIGELTGDGTGSDADNPLIPMDHEGFDPSVDYPKYHLTTAFYQATEILKDEGGTIVVCGPVYFGINESYGSGPSTRDVFTAQFGTNTIKITSVYNGVDYRETAGAKITIASPAEIGMYGQSIWENIDIETADTYRVLSFSNYTTLIGEGVNCYPDDEAFEGVAANYPCLSAGHRYSGGVDLTTNLLVKSGTYNIITAGEWGVNNQKKVNADGSIAWCNNLEGNTVANLVIEGTTTVYGKIVGTNNQGAEFSGQTNITLNGGNFECDIYGVGQDGMMNADGKVTITVNGGDFKNVWSLNNAIENCKNNLPAVSILDFSGWKGELSELANAYNVVGEFSEIKLPAGVTADQIMAAITTAPEETEEPEVETQAPATSAPAVEDTKAPETDEEATKAPETNAPVVDNDAEEEGGNMTLIIIIVVAVVVVAGVVIGIVASKKKAK